jgi:hypothetical protein
MSSWETNNPTDQDFIEHIRRYIRRHYSKEDIAAARIAVRGGVRDRDPDLLRRQIVRGRLSRLSLLGKGPPKTC